MSKYFQVSTNHSPKNQQAIATIPYGIIHRDYRRRYFQDKNYWQDGRLLIIKCDKFSDIFEVVKYLRKHCSWVKISRTDNPIVPETKDSRFMNKLRKMSQRLPPLKLKGNHSEVNSKMIRNYDLSNYQNYLISESREDEDKILLDNTNDVIEILNGDLDLLNLARIIN